MALEAGFLQTLASLQSSVFTVEAVLSLPLGQSLVTADAGKVAVSLFHVEFLTPALSAVLLEFI